MPAQMLVPFQSRPCKAPRTLVARSATVVRDATIDPLKAGNSTGEVHKGSKVVVARVITAIVDQPGERA
jgi:hypothetical protein